MSTYSKTPVIPPPLCPRIFGFDRLFHGDKPGAEGAPRGFPHASTVLITGASGTGKTVLALSIARSLMEQDNQSQLVYISSEMNRSRLAKDFRAFGWFGVNDAVFSQDRVQQAIFPDLGVFHRASSAASQVTLTLEVAAESFAFDRTETYQGASYLIVDSITALLKDARDRGERRRQAYELIVGLNRVFAKLNLGIMLLISEYEQAGLGRPDEIPTEEYLADFVFKPRLKPLPSGKRLRILEITKSHGANLRLGDHTFRIVAAQSGSLERIIAGEKLRSHIRDTYFETDAKGNLPKREWGGVIIFAQPTMRPLGRTGELVSARSRIWSGTHGLDAMLTNKIEYWAGRRQRIDGLIEGSTTLLLGSAGTGKTLMSLQFLLSNPRPSQSLYVNFERESEYVKRMFPSSPLRRDLDRCHFLYFRRSGLDVNHVIAEICWLVRHKQINRIVIDGLSDLLVSTDRQQYSEFVNMLIEAIRHADSERPERLPATLFITYEMPYDFKVVDPPSEGLSVTADNVVVLRQLAINDELHKTIYILKARGCGPDRQVREIRVIDTEQEGLEGTNQSGWYDRDVAALTIHAGFEQYGNLLSGEPRPLKVALQLFAENEPEQLFNQMIINHLGELFGFEVAAARFSRAQIRDTLRDAISPNLSRVPPVDIKVLNLDEWWIREYGVISELISTPGSDSRTHPLLGLNQFYGRRSVDRPYIGDERSSSENWVFESEKASHVALHGGDTELLAVPSYMDFGLFCVNGRVMQLFDNANLESRGTDSDGGTASTNGSATPDAKDSVVDSVEDREILRGRILGLPRFWTYEVESDGSGPEPPFASPSSDRTHPSLLDMLQGLRERNNGRWPVLNIGGEVKTVIGFAFDMETVQTAVCTFLEFCWSFGADEDFIHQDAMRYWELRGCSESEEEKYVRSLPMTRALKFLQFLVLNEFMPHRVGFEECKRAILSREWYSTIGALMSQRLPEWLRYGESVRGAQESGFSDEFGGIKNKKIGSRFFEDVGDIFSRLEEIDNRVSEPLARICPVPFFPVGSVMTECNLETADANVLVQAALKDTAKRLLTLSSRVLAAVYYRVGKQAAPDSIGTLENIRRKLQDEIALLNSSALSKDSLERRITTYRNDGRIIFDSIRVIPELLPGNDEGQEYGSVPSDLRAFGAAARWLDTRDVRELVRWNDFRLDIIGAELSGRSLGQVLRGDQREGAVTDAPVTALTGYSCSGSWMLGVLRASHSPELSWKLMSEMTSLPTAVVRARLGAGIPPRKDFFEFHGHEPVKNVEDLTWNALLKWTGSRARRRERIVCGAVPIAVIFETIYGRMQECLQVAEDARQGKLGLSEADAYGTAESSIREILRCVITEFTRARRVGGSSCPGCPDRKRCDSMLS